MNLKYRPDIDGLRSISVFSVIFYHANFIFFDIEIFSGGFIGVDVFFVISGYLITSLILNELSNNNFTISNSKRPTKSIISSSIGSNNLLLISTV